MLQFLAGSCHEVHTGLCARKGDKQVLSHALTKVYFVDADIELLEKYHRSIYSSDKAGGYAIQMAGSIIVEKIEGCHYNVVGMPVVALNHLLENFGVSLWDYIKA